ncbi:MAG: 23S rRNA (adenine(2503)-C(2))-methyltransferase RlmN [Planctomycetaceae bacterium]|jgi:23S rRNA (adenine2503-C2)-methyltransferase|nr:23S rRNA (adenine(2503)-C(2))-methyltransferase RlmN [Planctomycetaceae bacterium]
MTDEEKIIKEEWASGEREAKVKAGENAAAFRAELEKLGLPGFRVEQIRRWIFSRKTADFMAMTDLPLSLRRELAEKFDIFCGTVVTCQKSQEKTDEKFYGKRRQKSDAASSNDPTEKLLLEWRDGHRVECVLLRDNRNHRTACISTQVGCAMGCLFCASGLDGFVRNLTRGEILEQILRLNQLLRDNERLTHLVIMGTGEPMLNLKPLLSALNDATAADSLDVSKRRVTISTVGIPRGIEQLADADTSYRLAVSLHAPNDALRDKIVPQNKQTGLSKILKAAEYFFEKTGRRVTFEYILIDRVNDQPEHARELALLLKNRTAIVNLIPFNPVKELPYHTPSSSVVRRFAQTLEQGGIDVKIRFKRGDGINAACGQLRRSFRNI